MPPYTPEAIRAMDGLALTRAAFQLGLAPEGTEAYCAGQLLVYGPPGAKRDWHPHADLDQANAVFRRLRARGWRIVQDSTPDLDGLQDEAGGHCLASRAVRDVHLTWWCTPPRPDADMEPSEAMALLRVSVLAAASERTP